MTNPGSPGGDERPLTVNDPVVPEPDPLLSGDPLTDDLSATPPLSRPAAPTFEPMSDSPVYDEVVSTSEDFEAIGDTGGAVFGEPVDGTAGGALDKVKAFAARSPQVFLGVAIVAGFLLGRVFSSSSDDDEDS